MLPKLLPFRTTTEASAPNATDSSAAYLAPSIPMQSQTASKDTDSSVLYPKVDLFLGYSFVRFNTNAGVNENFDWHGATGAIAGNVNRWFSPRWQISGFTPSETCLPAPVAKRIRLCLVR